MYLWLWNDWSWFPSYLLSLFWKYKKNGNENNRTATNRTNRTDSLVKYIIKHKKIYKEYKPLYKVNEKWTMEKFDKNNAEHEVVMTKLKYNFALKFASLICFSVVSCLVIISLFFGLTTTISGIVFCGVIIVILTVITFILGFRGAGAI